MGEVKFPEGIHEFKPFPLNEADIALGHVCNGSCACADCGHRKADKERHFQRRKKKV